MPIKYPKVEPYAALLEGLESEPELDCGCVLKVRDFSEDLPAAIEFYFCTLHNFVQQLLDALDKVATRAYRGVGPHEVRCRFCTLVIEDPSPSDSPPPEHDPDCPMNVVHQVIRRAKGGENHETNPGMPAEDPSNGL